MQIFSHLRSSVVLLLVLTVLGGGVYPALVTLCAQLLFAHEAGGSLIIKEGVVVGSTLIGQQFSDKKYVWGRPSATTPPYNPSASSGSNLGVNNSQLKQLLSERIHILTAAHSAKAGLIPIELITTSGSGLDPHISLEAALYQAQRISRARSVAQSQVEALMRAHAKSGVIEQFGLPKISVVEFNLALDEIKPAARKNK